MLSLRQMLRDATQNQPPPQHPPSVRDHRLHIPGRRRLLVSRVAPHNTSHIHTISVAGYEKGSNKSIIHESLARISNAATYPPRQVTVFTSEPYRARDHGHLRFRAIRDKHLRRDGSAHRCGPGAARKPAADILRLLLRYAAS